MEDMKAIAAYICNRYEYEYGMPIDEMKLHKLMYFAQRESYIQYNEPLFKGTFYGWRYGPVLKEIRQLFATHVSSEDDLYENYKDNSRISNIMNVIFSQYAPKDSWSLSRLTHGEYSWQQSRVNIPEHMNSDNPIDDEDILVDAKRIHERRRMLAQKGFM